MCRECNALSLRIDQTSICFRCGHASGVSTVSCVRCSTWHPALQACRSVFEHSGPPQRAIHRFKYSHEYARAEWCASELNILLQDSFDDDITLVPMPLHPKRQRQRGYNQAALICEWLAKRDGYAVCDALMRVRQTPSQVGLDAGTRAQNVVGAIAPAITLAGLHIVLVDDVVTTGSTLNAAAIACRRAGALSVRAATVATGV